jgi:glutathione S-transferase
MTMADYTFFTNPMSRGQIGRWALHEAGVNYKQVLIDWKDKPEALLAANPMGKVPTIIHHAPDGDRVVSEAAAICAYLAVGELAPREEERADYYRWLFFCAGPVEQAVTARMLAFEPKPEQEGMAGFGSYDRTVDALDGHLGATTWVCGDRFTMADVYVGSTVDWGLNFGSLPNRDSFVAYAERFRQRPAYQAAKAIDMALIAEKQS